jgi:hypothetical protein
MAAPNLQWYDDADVLITAQETLPTATPGTPTAETEYRLFNNKDAAGADTATNRWLEVLERQPGETPFLGSSRELTDRHWMRVRILGGLGGLNLAQGAEFNVGAGVSFPLPDLANGQGVRLGISVDATADAQTAQTEVTFRVAKRQALPVPAGLSDSAGDGVAVGLFDGRVTGLVSGGLVEEDPGGAGDDVMVRAYEHIGAGIYRVTLDELHQLDGDDGSAVALASGEEYFALVYIDVDGDVQILKSDKGSSPLDPSEEPAVPADGTALAMVTRQFDAIIDDADIDDRRDFWAAGFESAALTATIGPTRGLVDDARTRTSTPENASLTASETNRIYRVRDGSLAVDIAGTRPEPRALDLWEAVTDGSGVTALTDLRPIYGMGFRVVPVVLRFQGTLAGGQQVMVPFPVNRDAQVLPLFGVQAWLDDVGAGTGGATVFNVEASADGAAYATLFTSSGSDDRRPTVAFDATVLRSTGLPEVTQIQRFSRLRASVAAVPSGGAAPGGATVVVLLAVL